MGTVKDRYPHFYDECNCIITEKLVGYLYDCGFKPFKDVRFKELINELVSTELVEVVHPCKYHDVSYALKPTIPYEEFNSLIERHPILKSILDKRVVVQDFVSFKEGVEEIFNELKSERSGKITTYIPGLANYSLDNWSVAFCSIDGQVLNLGNVDDTFTIQSAMKPILYGIVCDKIGYEEVHKYVGKEPSGFGFNKIKLGYGDIPHNPLINIGAITIASLCSPDLPMSERFELAFSKYKALAAGARNPISFNNMVYLSEKASGHRNYAIGHYLVDKGVINASSTSKLMEVLELYFQMCSIEVDTPSMAVMAASLANGGKNVFTGEQVVSVSNVQNMLTLMYSCGMYDYSGEWSFEVGLPAKSGVSGSIMVVLPNIGGLAMWSPPLDTFGNSVRGVHFTKQLLARYSGDGDNKHSPLHPFSNANSFSSLVAGKRLLHPKRQYHTLPHQYHSVPQLRAVRNSSVSRLYVNLLKRLPRI